MKSFRLYNVTRTELEDWRRKRMEIGQLEYGDRDLKRYNLVDVVEELLDVVNIMERFENRLITKYGSLENADLFCKYNDFIIRVNRIKNGANELIKEVKYLDRYIKWEDSTDENGGERIWLNKYSRIIDRE